MRRNFQLILFLLVFPYGQAHAQDTLTTPECPITDLRDIVRSRLLKKEGPPPVKANALLLVPIIGSNPATGFMFGVGGQYTFKMPQSTQYSILSGSVQATTKSQFMVLLKNTVYTPAEKFFLQGDWRFQIFSQSTYGLGTSSPEGGALDYQYSFYGYETNEDSLAQPMEFNFVRFHQTVAYRIKKQFYLGLGYLYDGYYDIVDSRLRLNPGDTLLTSHYLYNKYYEFDTEKYYSSALSASVVVDKRDNMIQAHKGFFLSMNIRGAFEFLGSTKNASLFQVEWRSFHGVSKRNPAHLVGFWALGEFSPEGQFPYLILPATAYDQRSRSGRGYTQGRFRGNNYVYAEAEYRFPLSRCSAPLSGVAFINAATTDNPIREEALFDTVRPAGGIGLRILLDKNSRSNLVLDYAIGQKSSGFYLAVAETF
jgi:hypothetical protein